MRYLLNIELRNESFEMLDQAWEETLMAVDIEPDVVLLDCLFSRHLEKSIFMKNALAL